MIDQGPKPRMNLILGATLITLGLWFIPFADWFVYPIRLFVTFIHESCHAVAAAMTGSSVKGLVILPNGGGFVVVSSENWFSSFIIASAGYLGTVFCGAALLLLIKQRITPGSILIGIGFLVGINTLLFGFLVPLLNFFELISFADVLFTTFVGISLFLVLTLLAKKLSKKWQEMILVFLAVQLILNAFLDLKNLLILNAPILGSDIKTDATNMEQITGVPAILWIIVWIFLSVIVVSVVLRLYATGRKRDKTSF